MFNLVTKILVKGKLIIRGCVRSVYRGLPLSEYNKYRLKSYFYAKFGVSTGETISYQDMLASVRCVHGYVCQSSEVHRTKQSQFDELIEFNEMESPTISIIIPVDNNPELAFCCLKSIYDNAWGYSYEIIIVDDGSYDKTHDFLGKIRGIHLARNNEKLGFIRSCNRGASIARGEYLLLLNSHTVVLPHWMDELVNTFLEYPEAGLAGSKLLYTDGSLRAAGGIVLNDGSLFSCGEHDDPLKPEYCYLREVDYCTHSLMMPKRVFEELVGFDEGYMPGHYGEVDLSFSIWSLGRMVLYQPLSRVVCFGNNALGEEESQEKGNKLRFYEKWNAALTCHERHGQNLYPQIGRKNQKRILIMDAFTPTPDQDSGSVDTFSYMKIFRSLQFDITFIPAANLTFLERYTPDLQRIGVQCLYVPYVTHISRYLEKSGSNYDVVLLYRVHCSSAYIDSVRKYCSRAKVIFDTVDLHYLREQRQAMIESSEELAGEAEKTKALELSVIKKSDFTIVLSEAEQEILRKELGVDAKKIVVVPLIREIPGTKTPFKDRRDILFIGGYKHEPNVDAVFYFVDRIWPLVKQRLPELKFYIIGSNIPQEIVNLSSADVVVVGYVEDISEYFDRCRLSIAPMRYGAGLKGKIGASMAYGVPCVASSMAVEGAGFISGEEIIVADEPGDFADSIAKVYCDEHLWNYLSRNGLSFVQENYSIEAGKKKLRGLLRDLGVWKDGPVTQQPTVDVNR